MLGPPEGSQQWPINGGGGFFGPGEGGAGGAQGTSVGTGGACGANGVGGANGSATGPDSATPPAKPTVTKVAPPDGPLTGGTTVTVSGSNFTDQGAPAVTSVTFVPRGGGAPVAATTFHVANDTTLTAVTPNVTSSLPKGASALMTDVQVSTSNGSSAVDPSADQFVFGVHIASITPNTAPPGGRRRVTITGTGFGPAGSTDEVDFFPTIGGHVYPLSDIKVVSDSKITAVVPKEGADIADPGDNGAATVAVIIDPGTGTPSSSNPVPFTYQLHVNPITPNTAPPRGRTPVTITGTRFGPAGSTDEVDFFPTIGGHVYPLAALKVVSDAKNHHGGSQRGSRHRRSR